MGPDALFRLTLQIQLMLHRDLKRGQAADLESRYESQKGQHHYDDDDNHYDENQVVGAQRSTSLKTHPAPRRAASSAEPL